MSEDKVMPIAIVGMACRFPGDGENVESLFEMLKDGRNAWSEFPTDRVNIDGFFHPSGNRQGSIGFKGAHFLKGDIKAFDASFFNISAPEAQAMDPQQRMLLEETYHALENAGISRESLELTETTVNVGTFVKDYEQVVLRDQDWAPQYAATGTGNAILSNRISHVFNLRGPSQTVDTGCSASLVGIHNCCQDLRTGRSSLAIAAGVGMILTPATMMPMTALNFLSKDGKCFTFTDRANGYGRGEGVGVVILKRLDDAIRDNDMIRAVIRGSRVNQDGRTPGITMPSADSQHANITALYKEAGLGFDKTAYVECHGTGTPAGDPKESLAISRAFCSDRAVDNPILIGSIKPNVGHLEGAAGIAGVIKAVMSVERAQITKNLYFAPAIANPDIKFKEWRVKVPTELTPWPMEGLRRASVNCFGFGGTNAHVVIDDAGHYLSERGLTANHRSTNASDSTAAVPSRRLKTFASTQLFVISHHEHSGISRIIDSHASYIAAHSDTPGLLQDYAYTLSRRSALDYKTFIVAQSPAALISKLERAQDLKVLRSVPGSDTIPSVALVFCGQGAQWYAMGRELMEYDVFAHSIIGASKFLKKIVGSDFDLLEELRKDRSTSRIDEPKYAQPATTAIQVALVELLKVANIIPTAVVGHSSGEIAAAYAAGHLTREDAWLISFYRGHYTDSITEKHPELEGRMMAVGLSAADAQKYVDSAKAGSVIVACHNSPQSVTLSGDKDQILHIGSRLTSDGIFHRLLVVATAYHSQHMKTVEDEYRESLQYLKPQTVGSGPQMFSSVTGQPVSGSDLDTSYWTKNLVSPVLFDQAFSAMYKTHKPDLVIEASPASTLNRPVQEIMKAIAPKKSGIPCLPMLKKDQNASVTALETMGEMWARGYPAGFSWVWTSREGLLPTMLVDMPPYPFSTQKTYWFESHLGTALRFRTHGREDLIGAPVPEATPQDPRWRGFFRLSENPWLSDHQVQKTTIYPAAGLITMALEAARQCTDSTLVVGDYQISNFTILAPVIIPAGGHGLEHSISAKALKIPTPDAAHASAVYSFSICTKTEVGKWQENAKGQFTIFYNGKPKDESSGAPEYDIQANAYQAAYYKLLFECREPVNARRLYERLDSIGMNYGPMFQNMSNLMKNANSCTSVVRIPDTKSRMPANYEYDHLIHPATLDSMFQTVFAVGNLSMVPSSIRQISFSPNILKGAGAEFHGYATAQLKGLREATADIIMSAKGSKEPMVIVEGMEFIQLSSSEDSSFLPSNRHLCSEILWQDLGVVSIPDASMGQATITVLLPDGYGLKDVVGLADAFVGSLNNIKVVPLRQLTEADANNFCVSFLEIQSPLLFDIGSEEFGLIKLLLKNTPGLLWLTSGAQNSIFDARLVPFHGLARTIRSEDVTKRIATLDLDVHNDATTSVAAIMTVFNRTFISPDLSDIQEFEYSLRDGKLFGARLSLLNDLNKVIENGPESAIEYQSTQLGDVHERLKLAIGNIGDLTSVYFEKAEDLSLGPEQVRIQVASTHLFRIDVDTILGRTSEDSLGRDVVGTVTEVGDEVTNIAVGDLVLALDFNTVQTSVVVDQCFVQQRQDRMLLRGCSPSALTTAYFGLKNVGQISTGDTVFIHGATSAYGEAAVRVAKLLGAKVFAGVESSEQRDVLQEFYGLPAGQIIDTTKDRFSAETMRLTDHNGVDMVFNTTSDHIDENFRCVVENGNIFQVSDSTTAKVISIVPNQSSASFHKFDLSAMMKKRPHVVAKAWTEVYASYVDGRLGVCPLDLIHEDRVEDLEGMLTRIADRTTGSQLNVLKFTDDSTVRVGKSMVNAAALDPKATYVLIGGLGGLGRSIANLMVARGAKHLAFLSRSGASQTDEAFFAELGHKGAEDVRSYPVDVCDERALHGALTTMASDMPPVKGAIQCAAVIRDAVWETMTFDDWKAATRPKMQGSLNLHNLLPKDLDFFVFLSSASGVIGNRGQANYAAGNMFQDALAHLRCAQNMPTVSLDLGPIIGAGMLENDEKTLALLKASGFIMIELENFLFLVERAMASGLGSTTTQMKLPPQVVMGVGTGGLIAQNDPHDPYWTGTKLFELLNKVDVVQDDELPGSQSSSKKDLMIALKSSETVSEASDLVLGAVIEYLSVSLNLAPEDMDADRSLGAYGVDSLVASSFRSWIFKNIGVKLTDMEVMGSASIMELAVSIAKKGGFGGDSE